MPALVEAMKTAYAALSAGEAVVPLRSRLEIAGRDATALFMPAYVPGAPSDSLAVKLVTLFPGNPELGLPFIHAAVVVMDPDTGAMRAVLEGGELTARRTGAGAGAATDLMARPDSRRLAIFGAGVQARTQLEAVMAVRPIEYVLVYSPSPARVTGFIDEMSARFPAEYRAAKSPAEAAGNTDIICTATTAHAPVFNDETVRPGTHINAVGSYTPEMIEIPPETLGRARIAVDSRSACAAEAGELIAAVALGLVTQDAIVEIGEIVRGEAEARRDADEITVFKSVGVAVQDAVGADLALRTAAAMGLGTEVDWSSGWI